MSVLAAAAAEVVLVTYRDVKNGTNLVNPIPHLPMPSQLVSVGLVYGVLALFPDNASTLASLIGWGFVVATLLNVFTPASQVTTTNVATNQSQTITT
jgi:hypothetical protein